MAVDKSEGTKYNLSPGVNVTEYCCGGGSYSGNPQPGLGGESPWASIDFRAKESTGGGGGSTLFPEVKNLEPNYVFNEKKVLEDVLEYIKTTYGGHYSGKQGQRIQVTEFAVSHCDSPQDALRFNVLKYAARYGHKNGFNKADLLKSIHYLVMMINYHDEYLAERE